MRIAQVAPLYESVPPKLYGGTERIVSWLTEELVRQGHEVTLFASGDSQTRARLIPVAPGALRLNEQVLDEWPHIVLELEHVMQRADEFDFVHWHIDFVSFPLARRLHTPNVTTLHGRLDLPDLVSLYREFWDIPVISISDAQRAPLPWLNWQATIHHGLPENLLSPRDQPGKYLAVLGRISPEKGVDRAIEIAKRVDMPLKIAAKISKPDRPYFEQVIKPLLDHPLIEFVGEIGQKEKNDFLGDAYAVLFPINWPEPFGIVTIEAMACGTPLIAFPGGSVAEIIQDGVNGFIATDIDQAVAAVRRVPELDRPRCRQVFEERFTAARMTRDYVDVYHRLIEHRIVRFENRYVSAAEARASRAESNQELLGPSSPGTRVPSTRSDPRNGA